MNKESKVSPGNSGRLVLLLVAAVFFVPLIGAIVLFQSGWRPLSQVNYGELVQPARLLADTVLTTLDGRDLLLSQLRKKWTMLYFGPADCNAACQQQLYLLRQVHIAQGAESDRIQRVYIVTGTVTGPGPLQALQKDYPDMQFLTGSADTLRQLAAQFQLPVGSPLDNPGRVYLVDPAGYLMMSYPAHAEGEGMRRDLVRLLKISKSD
jgi:cytochrome oxidase Cu insertion factor (SCO1/SenC/PrrC family)